MVSTITLASFYNVSCVVFCAKLPCVVSFWFCLFQWWFLCFLSSHWLCHFLFLYLHQVSSFFKSHAFTLTKWDISIRMILKSSSTKFCHPKKHEYVNECFLIIELMFRCMSKSSFFFFVSVDSSILNIHNSSWIKIILWKLHIIMHNIIYVFVTSWNTSKIFLSDF